MFNYLLNEVLSNMTPAMRSFLLKTSILGQMCSSLCATVIGSEENECQACLAWLEQANMFTVALDSRGAWYRYHHLFRELLRQQLAGQASTDEIATLHTRASAWFASQGALEEALQHALLGHDTEAAVRLLAEQRHTLMDTEQWQLYERVLRMFPADAVAQYPDLTLAAAWMARVGRFDTPRVMELLDQAESLLAQAPDQTEHAVHLHGEIDALRSILACEAARDPESVIALAQRALAATPRAWYYVRSSIWIYLAAAHQMAGNLNLAYAALSEGQPEDVAQDGAVRGRVAGSRCFVEWMAGDLEAISHEAAQLRAVSERHNRRESLGWGHFLLSTVAYERNDLTTAEAHAMALEDLRYVGRPLPYLQSAFIYASICQARGQPDQAQHKLHRALDFLQETRSEGLVPLAKAFQAQLAVVQGDLGAAGHWATTTGRFLPLGVMPYFYSPQLTLPKILLAQNTRASREEAAAVLSRLHAFVTARHNIPITIVVLALQAMLHDAQQDEGTALSLLRQAVALAEPGGFIRLFADLGPRLASLLIRLRQTGFVPGYTGQILQAFGESTPAVFYPEAAGLLDGQIELIEPLTERELEVLTLLAQRLTAKEIAQVLVISPMTAKRYASTIYQKLRVHGRREAVDKASRLGLL